MSVGLSKSSSPAQAASMTSVFAQNDERHIKVDEHFKMIQQLLPTQQCWWQQLL
jgi:hypothetical protein